MSNSSDSSEMPEVSPDDNAMTSAVSSSVDSAPPAEVLQLRYPLCVHKPNPKYSTGGGVN